VDVKRWVGGLKHGGKFMGKGWQKDSEKEDTQKKKIFILMSFSKRGRGLAQNNKEGKWKKRNQPVVTRWRVGGRDSKVGLWDTVIKKN